MIDLSGFDILITVGDSTGYSGDFAGVLAGLDNFATLQAALDEVAEHDSGLIFVYPGSYPVTSNCNFRKRVAVRGLGDEAEDCLFYGWGNGNFFRYLDDAEVFIENVHFRSPGASWRTFIVSAGTGWKLWGNKARWEHGNTSCHGLYIGNASRDDYTCLFTNCTISAGYNFIALGRRSRFSFSKVWSRRNGSFFCWNCISDGWGEYDVVGTSPQSGYGAGYGDFEIDVGLFVDQDTAAKITIESPVGSPSVLLEEKTNRAGLQIESPLGVPSALGKHWKLRKAEIEIPSPLGGILAQGSAFTPPADLSVAAAWDYAEWEFGLSFSWASNQPPFTGVLEYGGDEYPFTTQDTFRAFLVPPDTAWAFTVRLGTDGPSASISGTTGPEIPAQITGISFTPSVDSLTFTWDPAARADEYRARLYRNGTMVEEQTVATETVVFTGLEDGIAHTLEISGVNETGPGLASTQSAQTLFIPPTAPLNLEQAGKHWVMAKVEWDAPPEKVTFYESIVLLDGDEVFKSIVPVDPTERLFLLPKAGKTYQWMVRAGNPGGLSAFAQIDIFTRAFFVDSRLAMLPSAYQEDFLFPDTWDGGTDIISEGVGDPQIARGSAKLNIESLDTRLVRKQPILQISTMRLDLTMDVGPFTAIPPVRIRDSLSIDWNLAVGPFAPVQPERSASSMGVDFNLSVGPFASDPPLRVTDLDFRLDWTLDIGNFDGEEDP